MSAIITMLNEITQRTSSEEVATTCVHPLFTENKTRWEKMRDLLGGEDVVKDLGETYLPKTDGQKRGPNGSSNYDAYKTRAVFWDYVREIAVATEGMLARKEPGIKLPPQLDTMVAKCTPMGQSIADFISVIQSGQVEYGRMGILSDIPNVPNPAGFYLYGYPALKVLNWNTEVIEDEDRLTFVLLDESAYTLNGLQWQWTVRFRVCALDWGGQYYTALLSGEALSKWDLLSPGPEAIYPMYRGKRSDRVPFAFANVTGATEYIERPPLENVADLTLALYRAEADYRQSLFMQGQATPAFFGFTESEIAKIMLGAGGGVFSTNTEARTEFLEPSGTSLSETRTSIENLHAAIVSRGVALLESNQSAESGEALKQRITNKTASVTSIANATDAAMNQVLRICARWCGVNPDGVEVSVNKDFHDVPLVGGDLVQFMQSWTMGAPITIEDIYGVASRAGIALKSYEETLSQNEIDRGASIVAMAAPDQKDEDEEEEEQGEDEVKDEAKKAKEQEDKEASNRR